MVGLVQLCAIESLLRSQFGNTQKYFPFYQALEIIQEGGAHSLCSP